MTRAKQIKYIVIHTQAGNGTLQAMQAYWKSIGWKSPGYARWIDYDGTVHNLAQFNNPTNGVQGFNSQCIHISYRGGIEIVDGKIKGKDTRTQAQKNAILNCIIEALNWLEQNGNDLQDVMVLGHYQFSTDKNQNGIIEFWERIKECPCYDAYKEYFDLMLGKNPDYKKLKLPKNRKK